MFWRSYLGYVRAYCNINGYMCLAWLQRASKIQLKWLRKSYLRNMQVMQCHNFLSNKRQVLLLTMKVVQLYHYPHTRSYCTNPNLDKVTGFLQMHIFQFSLKLYKKQHFLVFWSQPFTCKIKLVKFKLMVALPHPTWPNKTKSKF